MGKPRLLDLFCGGGGCSVGYARAGFEVIGVDLEPHPNYPYEFHQADALTFPLEGFDAYSASPPCQGYSVTKSMNGKADEYPKLIDATRDRLRATGLPYVIENVEGAKRYMVNPVMLCGTMFDLTAGEYELRRHRLFEASFEFYPPKPCNHNGPVVSVFGGHAKDRRRRTIGVYGEGTREGSTGKSLGIAVGAAAMRIDWMNSNELSESIPPAYTEYIGEFLTDAVALEVAA